MPTIRLSSWLNRHPFVLFVFLYAVIAALAALGDALLPQALRDAAGSLMHGAGLGIADPSGFGRVASQQVPQGPPWALATVAMVSGGVLSVPVAWLYTITRQKRGYRQSVVQTLILLPVVVAGVVVLVKFSLALAFSLAGIVAAVRFRNTLEDSKDAVFIFVATGIGLAAGVELTAAVTLSFLFNLATLLLFVTDFGRTPGGLEGVMADERLRRAVTGANRKSQFVARLDSEILEALAPQQLEALAERVLQRKREADERLSTEERMRPEYTLRFIAPDLQRARTAIEPILTRDAKRWVLRSAGPGEHGTHVLDYVVRPRKSIPAPVLLEALRADPDAVTSVELI